MIIVGAKGFAKEVLEILHQLDQLKNLAFYDAVFLDDCFISKFTYIEITSQYYLMLK